MADVAASVEGAAEALVSLIRSLGVPAWLSYTIEGNSTRAGQPLADAFAVAAGVPEIVAVGVNCCAPEDVPLAIGSARETGKPVIVYPNSGASCVTMMMTPTAEMNPAIRGSDRKRMRKPSRPRPSP